MIRARLYAFMPGITEQRVIASTEYADLLDKFEAWVGADAQQHPEAYEAEPGMSEFFEYCPAVVPLWEALKTGVLIRDMPPSEDVQRLAAAIYSTAYPRMPAELQKQFAIVEAILSI